MITQDKLKELFTYNEDGTFTRNSTGKVVKCSKTKGQRYLRIGIDSKPSPLHRMIFLYHHGYLPEVTDHIDGNRYNNRIENLREVTQQQNCLNRTHTAHSKSPYKNVYWNKAANKWAVVMSVDGIRKYFGLFEDIDLADLVAQEARSKYHGAYARNF
jgi:hypothetical protein